MLVPTDSKRGSSAWPIPVSQLGNGLIRPRQGGAVAAAGGCVSDTALAGHRESCWSRDQRVWADWCEMWYLPATTAFLVFSLVRSQERVRNDTQSSCRPAITPVAVGVLRIKVWRLESWLSG